MDMCWRIRRITSSELTDDDDDDTTSDQQSNNVEKEVLALLSTASAANYRQLSVQRKPVCRLHG